MANRKRNIQMKFWVTEEGNWLIDEKMSQFPIRRYEAPHMDGQAFAVKVVRLVAQEVGKLGVHEGRHEIEGTVRVRKDGEQRRFPVAQGAQLQLVFCHRVPQLLDVEGASLAHARVTSRQPRPRMMRATRLRHLRVHKP